MGVELDIGKIRKVSWKAYLVRFLFGGVITALTGVIAAKFGPVVGGLFLAFPAILPASLTLIEKEDGNEKAGVDARGATIGAAGLLVFGSIVWALGTRLSAVLVLALATALWFTASALLWLALKKASIVHE